MLDYRYMELQVQKLHIDAKTPMFAHSTDAGMDLYSAVKLTIGPGQRVQVPTGIAVAIPEGYAGLVWDKSGLSHNVGLKSLGGVIDAGYRGEILVGLLNTSEVTHTFQIGDKIAQLIIQKVEHLQIVVVNSLDETTRGAGAFGSTGV